MHTFLRALSFLLLLTSQGAAANNGLPLNVVVTIKPLHSLVASLMNGVKQPQLLLTTSQSVHHTNLRPSDHRKLASADIVFWAGATLESFIPTIEKNQRSYTQYISLIKTDGLTLLPIRGKHEHGRHEGNNHDNQHSNHTDPHFWLSTNNAKIIVSAITQSLINADASNASLYQYNKKQTLARIDLLTEQLKRQLGKATAPFITYHDAYQYFEKEFYLNRITSITLSEESTPGIKQIYSVKKLIAQYKVNCLFFDAPTQPPIINTLLNNTHAQAIALDAIGINLNAGPDLWFELLNNLSKQMAGCLQL